MSYYKPYPAYKDSGVEWLGRVPEHWEVTRISNHYRLRNGFAFDSSGFSPDGEGEDRLIRIRDLSPSENWIYTSEPCPDSARVNDGDVLVGMDGDFNAVLWLAGPAKLNQRVCALRGENESLTEFLLYSLPFPLKIINDTAYSTTVKHLSSGEVLDTRIALPPSVELRSIVSHLNSETARIDALIEKKNRFIELLREKRQALITHAVTKGLDPSVKMKDSGVEWLGEVPEHWCVKQLKHVVDQNSSITYGIVQAGPEFEGGVPYIRTSDMSGDELPVSGYPLTSPEIDASYARSRVRPGDIVMSIRASVGKCLPVPNELSLANLTQGTAKVSPGQKVTRGFLLAFLNSGAAQVYFDLMAKGATFKEITLDALRRTPVLLPPRDEQVVIDRFIALHVGRLDRLVRASECSVIMLKERRSALITAAVTGQIDLREAV